MPRTPTHNFLPPLNLRVLSQIVDRGELPVPLWSDLGTISNLAAGLSGMDTSQWPEWCIAAVDVEHALLGRLPWVEREETDEVEAEECEDGVQYRGWAPRRSLTHATWSRSGWCRRSACWRSTQCATWSGEVTRHSRLRRTLNSSSQSARVSTLNCVDSHTVLEDHERWHGSDAIFAGDLLLVVDVDFGECDGAGFSVLGGELLVDGGDGFAWAAPVCVDLRICQLCYVTE